MLHFIHFNKSWQGSVRYTSENISGSSASITRKSGRMTMVAVAGCGDEHRTTGCDSFLAGAGDGIETGAICELPDELDVMAMIDYAIQLTVADMPNALKFLENS